MRGEKGKGGHWKVRDSKAWKSEDGKETTVVLTGLPKTLNAEILLRLLDQIFYCSYDYFYLPMDMDKFENTGLAYINFRDHKTAVECQNYFNDKRDWGGHLSDRPCKAQWSSIQGYDANVERQQKAAWNIITSNMPEDCKPMAFDERGTRLPTLDIFPPSLTDSGKNGNKSQRTVTYNKDEGQWWEGEWYGGSPADATHHHDGTNGKSRWWDDSWSHKEEDWRHGDSGYKSKWTGGSWRHEDWHSGREEDWVEGEESYSDHRAVKDASASRYDSDSWRGGGNHRTWRNRHVEDAGEEYGEASQKSDTFQREPPATDEQKEATAWKHQDEIHEQEGETSQTESSKEGNHLNGHARTDKEDPPQTSSRPEGGSQETISLESLLPNSKAATSVAPPSLLTPSDGAPLAAPKYACPQCSSVFAKWSACQHHIVSEIRCRSVLLEDNKLPANLTELQDRCKAQAENLPQAAKIIKPFADVAIVEKARRFQ